MVNSFIRYSPYLMLDYEKNCVKAITSMMLKKLFFKILKCVKAIPSLFIKVCQGYHKHVY